MQFFLEKIEIDRLGQELQCPDLGGVPAALVIAIGSHHHDRQIGAALPVVSSNLPVPCL